MLLKQEEKQKLLLAFLLLSSFSYGMEEREDGSGARSVRSEATREKESHREVVSKVQENIVSHPVVDLRSVIPISPLYMGDEQTGGDQLSSTHVLMEDVLFQICID